MESNAPERAAYSVAAACAYIGISRPTMYRLLSDDIPSFHIGRRRLILKEHLDRFLQSRLAGANQ